MVIGFASPAAERVIRCSGCRAGISGLQLIRVVVVMRCGVGELAALFEGTGEAEIMGVSRSGGLEERGRARREIVRWTGVMGIRS